MVAHFKTQTIRQYRHNNCFPEMKNFNCHTYESYVELLCGYSIAVYCGIKAALAGYWERVLLMSLGHNR